MDFQTVLTSVMAVVETGALLMALMYFTVAMKAKKDKKKQAEVRPAKNKAIVAIAVYLILNLIRNYENFAGMFGGMF